MRLNFQRMGTEGTVIWKSDFVGTLCFLLRFLTRLPLKIWFTQLHNSLRQSQQILSLLAHFISVQQSDRLLQVNMLQPVQRKLMARYSRMHCLGFISNESEGITQISSFTRCRGLEGSIISNKTYDIYLPTQSTYRCWRNLKVSGKVNLAGVGRVKGTEEG